MALALLTGGPIGINKLYLAKLILNTPMGSKQSHNLQHSINYFIKVMLCQNLFMALALLTGGPIGINNSYAEIKDSIGSNQSHNLQHAIHYFGIVMLCQKIFTTLSPAQVSPLKKDSVTSTNPFHAFLNLHQTIEGLPTYQPT